MNGIVQHWSVYSASGQTSFMVGPLEHQAHAVRLAYEEVYPHNGPYVVSVCFVSKVDGSLVAGTLDDEEYQYEAS